MNKESKAACNMNKESKKARDYASLNVHRVGT
jgi:hypothetical protein